MSEDPFDLPSWNLDQSLLWVSTRDSHLVWRARDASKPWERGTTWLLEVLRRSQIEDDINVHQQEAETALLRALQHGILEARDDLTPLPREWFDRAAFEAEGDPPTTIMARRVRSPDKLRDLRLSPEQLERVFLTPDSQVRSAKTTASAVDMLMASWRSGAPTDGKTIAETPTEPNANTRRKKSRPKRDRAKLALTALYDKAVPDQTAKPNVVLCREVQAWLKDICKLPKLDIDDNTILRAARRRK